MNHRSIPLSTVALTTALALAGNMTAQTAPTTPPIVLEIADASAWRARLGPTNVGSLLDAAQGRAIWEPLWEQTIAAVTGQLGTESEALIDALLSFEGTLRVGVTVDRNGPTLALMLEARDSDDVGDLAAGITAAQRRLLGATARDADVDGVMWTHRDAGQGVSVTEPRVEGTRLTVLAAPGGRFGPPAAAAAALAATPTRTTGRDPSTAVAHLHLDLARILPFTDLGDEAKIAEQLGFGAFGSLDLALAARGPRLATLVDLELTSPLAGIMAGLMPDASVAMGFLAAPPSDALLWKMGRIDDEALMEGVIDLASDFADGRALAESLLGKDYEERLLEPFTGEFLFATLPPTEDEADPIDQRWLWAMRAEGEAKTLADGLASAFESSAWLPDWTGDEPRDIDGTAVRAFSDRDDRFWFGHRGSVLLLADGDLDERQVATHTAALAAACERAAEEQALPRSHRPLARELPPGLTGAAMLDVETALEGLFEALFLLLPEAGFRGLSRTSIDDQDMEALRQLLAQHQLTHVQTGTGRHDGHWRWRMFW